MTGTYGKEIPDIAALCVHELTRAAGLHEPFYSAHEGFAILQEEVDELWECVKTNRGYTQDAVDEAIQVAAMAMRYVLDCGGAVVGMRAA